MFCPGNIFLQEHEQRNKTKKQKYRSSKKIYLNSRHGSYMYVTFPFDAEKRGITVSSTSPCKSKFPSLLPNVHAQCEFATGSQITLGLTVPDTAKVPVINSDKSINSSNQIKPLHKLIILLKGNFYCITIFYNDISNMPRLGYTVCLTNFP